MMTVSLIERPCLRATPNRRRFGAAFAPGLQRLTLDAGEALYRTGDPCASFYVVERGSLRVQVASRHGRQSVLGRVQPGEACAFSASSLMSGRPYPACAVAENGTEVSCLPAARFAELMDGDKRFRGDVTHLVATNLDTIVGLLQEIAFDGVNARLAQLLLQRARTDPDIRDTHEGLALELGSAREVVSRLLKEFERNGHVRLARGRIEVLDKDALRKIECVRR